ncbi:MAG: dihydropteroate synthase [Chloroflexota bacterium]|jgi:dihydropteroate synthase|nr:dihydropteroate synthase [Chloroflexota bacterium]
MASELRWGERTYLMGIINVTPDSFSGDGLATDERQQEEIVAAALELGAAMVSAGADILDVGAESTRPRHAYGDHPEVDAATEASLAVPVVRALAAELGGRARISIDTSKGEVARAAVEAGATIVNDVWGARRDPGTADAAAASGAHLVLMHNQDGAGYPAGVFGTVIDWLREAIHGAETRGVSRERLIVDPGIGFGKTTDDNLELLHRLAELKSALGGLPVLIGTSRKRFLGELLDGAGPDDRVEGSAATAALAVMSGADIVRAHDVGPIARTLRVADAVVRR